jgi:hypothetical protein
MDRTATPEEMRAKASATLWWVRDRQQAELAAGPQSACPKCGGAGWVRDEAGAENGWRVETYPCACRAEVTARERWERALAASDITSALLRLNFSGYDAMGHPSLVKGRDAALAWASSAGSAGPAGSAEEVPDVRLHGFPWLFLYGSCGTGKTHLLASAFNRLMATGHYPLYTLVPALLDHVKEGLDANDKSEYAARFKAIKEAPILILDDLGAEKRTDWSDELLFKLLDYRYREELPTAVASNLLPSGLESRIASRLQDRALSVALLIVGPDYRLSGAQRARGSGKEGGA